MSRTHLFAGIVLAGLFSSSLAHAHISISSGPATADQSQKITLGVGHGCEIDGGHYDTAKIRVEIPTGFSGVRALFSDFGKPTLIRNGSTVTAVEWTKSSADILDGDDGYYELTFRARTPNAPFSQIVLTVHQTCIVNGQERTVVWTGTGSESPGPALTLIPARTNPKGWNKITIPSGVTVPADKLGTYFGDALIVWRGTEAFSTNANTAALIASTPGVSALSSDLVAGDEIWVRY
jgi:hypothetical protein